MASAAVTHVRGRARGESWWCRWGWSPRCAAWRGSPAAWLGRAAGSCDGLGRRTRSAGAPAASWSGRAARRARRAGRGSRRAPRRGSARRWWGAGCATRAPGGSRAASARGGVADRRRRASPGGRRRLRTRWPPGYETRRAALGWALFRGLGVGGQAAREVLAGRGERLRVGRFEDVLEVEDALAERVEPVLADDGVRGHAHLARAGGGLEDRLAVQRGVVE